jgi:hypothetical protein
VNKAQLARDVALLLPEAVKLVRALLERFQGDVPAVRAELRRIGHHGARLEQAEEDFDRRIQATMAKKPPPPPPLPDDDEGPLT